MYKKTIAVLLTLFLFQELLYASADDSTLCSGSDLSIISSTSDGSSNTSLSGDVGDVALRYLKDVKKITFNGEFVGVLALDGKKVTVFEADNLRGAPLKEVSIPRGPIARDLVFGAFNKLFCMRDTGFFQGFNTSPDNKQTFAVNFYKQLNEDYEKVLLLTDPYDLANPLSMINPLNGDNAERIVFCRDGLGTTQDTKVVLKEDKSLLVGALRLCRVNPSGTRLFCINVRNGHPIDRALCVDLRNGTVLASYPLIAGYEHPEEILFTSTNDLIVIDARRENLFISTATGEQRIPKALSVDIAHDDALVVANQATVALWKKIGHLYKKAATLSYEAFNATVRFNPTTDKIVHIAYDGNNIGIRCTILDCQLVTTQLVNIRPLGFMSGSGQLHFPRTNPGLLTLIGQTDGVILNVHDF